jgi:hypothetical protein
MIVTGLFMDNIREDEDDGASEQDSSEMRANKKQQAQSNIKDKITLAVVGKRKVFWS